MTKMTRQYIVEKAVMVLPYDENDELMVVYTDDKKKIIYDINTTEIIKEDVYNEIEQKRVYPNKYNIMYAVKDKKPLGLISYGYYDNRKEKEIITSYVPKNVKKNIYVIN